MDDPWQRLTYELLDLLGNDDGASWLRSRASGADAWSATERPAHVVALAAAGGVPIAEILAALVDTLGDDVDTLDAELIHDARTSVDTIAGDRPRPVRELWAIANVYRAAAFASREEPKRLRVLAGLRARLDAEVSRDR